jgi:DNA-binding SARP family transcriptional activator
MNAEFAVLGPLEVRRSGRPVPLRAGKQRVLLADLLVERGKVLSVDRLVQDLWQESPPFGARHALEAHASRLRGALGDAATLVAQPPGYVLEVDPQSIDAARFEQLLGEARDARATDPARAAELAADALALWRGPALADFAFEPFAQAEIARLEELRWEARHLQIDTELALGRTDLVPDLEALVAAEPLRERLRAQLMVALYRAGRQADALAAYRDARATLLDELGLEPGPELRELEAAILRQDEELARPTPAPAPPQRKLATILSADLGDAGGLALRLDPETYHMLLRRYVDAVTACVARHGGAVDKGLGEVVLAVFGVPVAHEDDALRALRAAGEIRSAVSGIEVEPEGSLSVRLGLATGEVLAGEGDALAVGPAVNVAARLRQETTPGEIAVDGMTRSLTAGAARFRDLGDLELRGLATPIATSLLEGLVPGAPALGRRLDAPLVGRERELAELRKALAAAARESALRVVTVLGPPGVGKSRLARELVADAADRATVLEGRCDVYGEGAALRPLREVLGSEDAVAEAFADVEGGAADAARLAAVFAAEAAVPTEEIPSAFRRYCETLASTRPVVLVLDDLHWAEPMLLDLLEQLASSASNVPILLVCLARDELTEERPRFPGAGERLVLEPLSDEETKTLADHLLPETVLDAATRTRLVTAAEGNPLFLEQLAAHVAETGLLESPPTLRALLAARLDRLGPGERGVLERAAVVGREFGPGEVEELLDVAATPTAAAHLDALVRRGFLRAPRADRFRFRHWLVHDAAYRAAPKELRAELHERLADVLDRQKADDELVGYHLEQAYHLCAELATPDRHARRLAEDAGRRLGAAGIRACKRNEATGASGLLVRAVALLPLEDEERRDLLCELGVAFSTIGEIDRADTVLQEARGIALRVGDRRVELRVEAELLGCHLLDDPQEASERLLDLAHGALPVFEVVDDDRSLGRLLMLTGWVHGGMHCQHALWKASAERALVHYRRAGWPVATCVGHIAAAAYFGPTPAPAGVDRCRSLLDSDASDRAGEANVLVYLGGLLGMCGEPHDALEHVQRAETIYAELGREPTIATTCWPIAATIERMSGDVEGAEAHLRASCTRLEALHNWNGLATAAAQLADLLVMRGELDEARTWVERARGCAAAVDVDAQISVGLASAKVLARTGRRREARDVAGAAVELAETTDATNLRARALVQLAELLDACGASDEADHRRTAALALYDEKGNAVAADAVRRARTPPARSSRA